MNQIEYKDGYKYQLVKTRTANVGFEIFEEVTVGRFIRLDREGNLTLSDGYASDGPSGPTIATKNFMRGSFFHDALYQLIREGLLDEDIHRKLADDLLYKMCREDGMSWLRAKNIYRGLRWFGASAALPQAARKVQYAP